MPRTFEQSVARGRGFIIILIIIFSQVAYGHPLIRELSDKPPPAGVRHFFPRGRCVWLLGLVGLAGVGTWGYFHYLHDDQDAVAVSGGSDPRTLPTLAEGPKPLFDGEAGTTFRFEPINGKPPTLTLFNRNGLQRTMAASFHSYMAQQENDPKRRHEWETAPPGIQASFEGVRIRPSAKDKSKVEIVILGNGEEAPVPQTVSRKALEGGKPVRLRLATQRYPIDKVGEASVSGEMTIQYLPDKGVLVLKQADLHLNATMFGMTTKDTGKFADLIARR